jgi:glycosyltransferase involved in cell wall biosynthesis
VIVQVPLSVVIPVKNEEVNIEACLRSVEWAGEIWVVDSQSQDRTAEIAESFGARVVQFFYDGGWPRKKNWALENLPFGNDWVLFVDADERVTPELRDEIVAVLRDQRDFDGFYINRRLIFLGRWIRHCGWYPSWNLRLFKHRLGRYERLVEEAKNTGDVEVHEHVVLKGKVGYLKNDLLHEDYKSIYHFVERHNRYSNWDAQVYQKLLSGEAADAQVAGSLLGGPVNRKRLVKRIWVRLPFRPVLRFLWMYFVRLGFLDGRPGLMFCMLMSFHEAMISAKIYEMTMRRSKVRR